jgi:hypothetical protein
MVAWQRGTLIKNYKTKAKRTRAERKYTFENTALHLLLLCLLYIYIIINHSCSSREFVKESKTCIANS